MASMPMAILSNNHRPYFILYLSFNAMNALGNASDQHASHRSMFLSISMDGGLVRNIRAGRNRHFVHDRNITVTCLPVMPLHIVSATNFIYEGTVTLTN